MHTCTYDLRAKRLVPGVFPVFPSQVTKKSPVGLFERNKMRLFFVPTGLKAPDLSRHNPPALAPEAHRFSPGSLLKHFSVFLNNLLPWSASLVLRMGLKMNFKFKIHRKIKFKV